MPSIFIDTYGVVERHWRSVDIPLFYTIAFDITEQRYCSDSAIKKHLESTNPPQVDNS